MEKQEIINMESTLSRSRASSIKIAKEKFNSAPPHQKGLIIIIIILLIISIALGIYSIMLSMYHDENIEFFNENEQWRNTCDRKCNAKFKVPPLLLISLDGFRADYLEKNITASVSKLLNCGTSAPYMYPTYPSKTFPNHYTIVTGLYPESHGIVANAMFDKDFPACDGVEDISGFPNCSKFSMKDKNSGWWYGGEPIWNTVKNERKKTGTFFWPGSYYIINGKKPDYAADYDPEIPFSKRVDQIIKWLLLPEADRPTFMAMYFHQPDRDGHHFGPDSDQVNSVLIYVDAMLNYLMSRLDQEGLLGCINIVLVSDHGMQPLYPDKFVHLYKDIKNYDKKNTAILTDVNTQIIYNENDNKTNYLEKEEVKTLKCKKGEQVFSKNTIPRRVHHSNNKRIGQIFIEGNPGIFMFIQKEKLIDFPDVSSHGYDNREPTMRAIFGAYGPSFKKNYRIKPFQNIELYNFMSAAMGLSRPAPNNGTQGSLNHVFVNSPDYPRITHEHLPVCMNMNLLTCGDSCHFELPLPNKDHCYPSHGIGFNPSNELCQNVLCNATIVVDKENKNPIVVESLLMDKISNLDHRANCSLKLDKYNDTICPKKQFTGTISLFSENDYLWFLEQARVPASDVFVNEIWNEFQALLLKYQRHYKTLRMFAGPVYDANNDGVEDEIKDKPTHVFVVLLRCSLGTEWNNDYAHCADASNSRVLSFVIPLNDTNFNCLHPAEYLYTYTSRVRDVELLTGLQFFTDRKYYSDQLSIELRTFISESLWQLEQQAL